MDKPYEEVDQCQAILDNLPSELNLDQFWELIEAVPIHSHATVIVLIQDDVPEIASLRSRNFLGTEYLYSSINQ